MSNDLIITPTLNLTDCADIVSVAVRANFDGSPIARVTLKNGWMLSVLSGGGFYATGDGLTFEVGLLNPDGELDYGLNDDVWGYQTPDQVRAIIKQAAALATDAPRRLSMNSLTDEE